MFNLFDITTCVYIVGLIAAKGFSCFGIQVGYQHYNVSHTFSNFQVGTLSYSFQLQMVSFGFRAIKIHFHDCRLTSQLHSFKTDSWPCK